MIEVIKIVFLPFSAIILYLIAIEFYNCSTCSTILQALAIILCVTLGGLCQYKGAIKYKERYFKVEEGVVKGKRDVIKTFFDRSIFVVKGKQDVIKTFFYKLTFIMISFIQLSLMIKVIIEPLKRIIKSII